MSLCLYHLSHQESINLPTSDKNHKDILLDFTQSQLYRLCLFVYTTLRPARPVFGFGILV